MGFSFHSRAQFHSKFVAPGHPVNAQLHRRHLSISVVGDMPRSTQSSAGRRQFQKPTPRGLARHRRISQRDSHSDWGKGKGISKRIEPPRRSIDRKPIMYFVVAHAEDRGWGKRQCQITQPILQVVFSRSSEMYLLNDIVVLLTLSADATDFGNCNAQDFSRARATLKSTF